MHFRFISVLLIGLVCLSALFVLLRPLPSQKTAGTAVEVPVNEVAPVVDNAPKMIAIVLQGGERVSGPEVIRVQQGEQVFLEFTSDEDVELHLHGYDHKLMLKAGAPYAHSFIAEHSGRFEYELHGHHAHHALGVIEVLPE